MSRQKALQRWTGRQVIDELAVRGIVVKSPSSRGVAVEAPGACKDVGAVVDAADAAGLSRQVAKLLPLGRAVTTSTPPRVTAGAIPEKPRTVHGTSNPPLAYAGVAWAGDVDATPAGVR
jgi:hypothetical protein